MFYPGRSKGVSGTLGSISQKIIGFLPDVDRWERKKTALLVCAGRGLSHWDNRRRGGRDKHQIPVGCPHPGQKLGRTYTKDTYNFHGRNLEGDRERQGRTCVSQKEILKPRVQLEAETQLVRIQHEELGCRVLKGRKGPRASRGGVGE